MQIALGCSSRLRSRLPRPRRMQRRPPTRHRPCPLCRGAAARHRRTVASPVFDRRAVFGLGGSLSVSNRGIARMTRYFFNNIWAPASTPAGAGRGLTSSTYYRPTGIRS